ncbi:MAG: DUF624 domain-containing protein [Bacillota bacterium]|nr:DUF624 domain-containing protein [Bacillota bacterium]
MGFFERFNPDRPGPGVEKDAQPKPVFFVFLSVYTRKFYKLLQLNLIHFVFNLPAIILAFIISENIFHTISPKNEFPIFAWMSMACFLVAVNIISVGPFQSGFSYILRNFSREEHAFVWSDYIKIAKKNLKQSLLMCLINILIFCVLSSSITWYISSDQKSVFLTIAVGLQALLLLIFYMMQLYTYQLLVTFDLKLRHIYKNALLFSLARFFPNLLILLLCFAFIVIIMFNIIIALILLPTFAFSVVGLITNFYANRVIKKYMLKD